MKLESQNNRLESTLFVLRKISISNKHSLDSLMNTTIAGNCTQIKTFLMKIIKKIFFRNIERYYQKNGLCIKIC